MIEYKGFQIDTVTFAGLITVFFCGDELAFGTLEEAKAFIDEQTK